MKKLLVVLLNVICSIVLASCNNEVCKHDFQGKCEEYAICVKCGAQRGHKKDHSYEGDCEDFRKCTDCGEIATEKIEHNYKGNIKIGALACENCKKAITKEDISQKSIEQLTDEERAYIYWWLNHILTLRKDGKYLYTTDVAFNIVSKDFNLSVEYLKEDFWGVNSMYNHNCYSKYYYEK
ncbi:MAG: hypothetical protein IJY62_01655 [Clostridia bacterium]|nr:hypothetical protein [Clostridia bacterium]